MGVTLHWSHPPAGNTRATLVVGGQVPVQDLRLLAVGWELAAWPVPGGPDTYVFHRSWGGR